METGSRALARDSTARALMDGGGILLGIGATVITARWLGPAGKGVLAVLTLLGLLVGRLSTGGLGDAAIVMVGQGRVRKGYVVRATLGGTFALSVVGVAVFAVAAIAQLQPSQPAVWIALAIFALSVPANAISDVLCHFLTMELRVIEASLVSLVTSAIATVGLLVFVVAFDLGIEGAALAVAVGVLAATGLAVVRLRGAGLAGPTWDSGYLKQGLGYGLRLELSHLVTMMAGRVDLLFVYSLAGATAAGFYSVALTAGAMATLPAFAVSFAVFPRLAYASEEEWRGLTASACRAGSGAALVVVVGMCALIPLAIPALLGSGFEAAVAPTLILVAASLLWNVQWTLGRAAAARGRPNQLLFSFGMSLGVMVALDLALIPIANTVGAALAAAVSYAIGAGVALRGYRRTGGGLIELLPRLRDIDPRSIRRRLMAPPESLPGPPLDPLAAAEEEIIRPT
jgi:O-antigen/teichoic acid export membrane protein